VFPFRTLSEKAQPPCLFRLKSRDSGSALALKIHR
jgi:hypothetical protein